jgi:hypothetical protein
MPTKNEPHCSPSGKNSSSVRIFDRPRHAARALSRPRAGSSAAQYCPSGTCSWSACQRRHQWVSCDLAGFELRDCAEPADKRTGFDRGNRAGWHLGRHQHRHLIIKVRPGEQRQGHALRRIGDQHRSAAAPLLTRSAIKKIPLEQLLMAHRLFIQKTDIRACVNQ